MIKICGLGTSCQSTRKARQWFKAQEIPFEFRDISHDPLSIEEIQHILCLTEYGTEDIISTRTEIYEELDLDIDSLSLTALYEYIQKYPRLLRYPLIFNDDKLQVGFNKHDIRKFIPREERKRDFWQMFQAYQKLQNEGI